MAIYLLSIIYIDRMSKETLCMSFGRKKSLQDTVPNNSICCLFTKIKSEGGFLLLLGASTMGRIHGLSWNERAETNLSTQLMTGAEVIFDEKGEFYKTIAAAIKIQNATPDIANLFSTWLWALTLSAVRDVFRLCLKNIPLWHFDCRL